MHEINRLIEQAWSVRQTHNRNICFSVPGAKKYDNAYYTNRPHAFVNLSVTGNTCSCNCKHCNGLLLKTMLSTHTPREMRLTLEDLMEKGCKGILISGGANRRGEVPLEPFLKEIAFAKSLGLRVLVHTGLVRPEMAFRLKAAGVDQVLLDIIGYEETIRDVYHLERKPVDYLKAMLSCRQAGLDIAPHVVIGLHYGRILGEFVALDMIKEAGAQTLVLVILNPMRGTAMAGVQPPTIEEVGFVLAKARLDNPDIPITLGCARPPGFYKREVERLAVDCGVNALAYPDQITVDYARDRGLEPVFTEECCSLAGYGAGEMVLAAAKQALEN